MNKRIWLTYVLAAINVVVFLLIWVKAGYASPSPKLLLDWGGNLAPMTLTGEPWRLLTSAFLHVGWMHLLVNLYMLVLLGSALERAMGWLRYGVVYFLSALGGSLLSSLWYGYHKTQSIQWAMGMAIPVSTIHPVVSAGASGALMGLAGAAAALHYTAWVRRTSAVSIDIKASAIVQVILLNLVLGFTTSGIDQAAHIGGLCAGFLIGVALDFALMGPRLVRMGAPLVIGLSVGASIFAGAYYAGSPQLQEWKALVKMGQTQGAQDGDSDLRSDGSTQSSQGDD